MISADIAASVVIREVSNNEQFFILLWLLIRCAEGYNLPRYHYSSHCIRLLWFPLPMYFSTHTCRWRCLRLSLNLFLKIYRCWIVWGCNTHVVIIPSILAIGFLGLPSAKLSSFTYWLKFIASSYLLPLATWAGGLSVVPDFNVEGRFVVSGLRNTLAITSLAMSMSVNALVMCLIVFRIFKVFQEVRFITTSDENSLGITGGTKLWSIMFIIIESGMALFTIQLARVAVSNSLGTTADFDAFGLIVGIHEMLNVIIISVFVNFYLLIRWAWLGCNTYYHPGTGIDGNVFPWWGIYGRSHGEFLALYAWQLRSGFNSRNGKYQSGEERRIRRLHCWKWRHPDYGGREMNLYRETAYTSSEIRGYCY